ncbi:MAG TPA: hypothetical protein PKD61_28100 [Polyangiaceae bacterium]|nr:hypothetical protein [Polyangiaceae bacterium]
MATLRELNADPKRYSGKQIRVRGRVLGIALSCIRSDCDPQPYLVWAVDPNSIMPEETSVYMTALRRGDGEPFGCNHRGCGGLRWEHCYELIGTFKHAANRRTDDGRDTFEVEGQKQIPDQTRNCGWSSAAWSASHTEEEAR